MLIYIWHLKVVSVGIYLNSSKMRPIMFFIIFVIVSLVEFYSFFYTSVREKKVHLT